MLNDVGMFFLILFFVAGIFVGIGVTLAIIYSDDDI